MAARAPLRCGAKKRLLREGALLNQILFHTAFLRFWLEGEVVEFHPCLSPFPDPTHAEVVPHFASFLEVVLPHRQVLHQPTPHWCHFRSFTKRGLAIPEE